MSAVPKGGALCADILDLALQSAAEAGVGLVHFSGGEALLQDELEDFVLRASRAGYFAEITTSTFTTPGSPTVGRVAALRAAGLNRVMLSYDEAHARRVPIDQYAEFMREALACGLEVCALVVEWPGSAWPIDRVRTECGARGVHIDAVDWCRTGLSRVGRAAMSDRPGSGEAAICPYVLTAPTLAPTGDIYLCPNARTATSLFRLGSVVDESLSDILARQQSSPFYRGLAAIGPHEAARRIGLPPSHTPADMCACCQLVLERAADDSAFQAVAGAAPPVGEPITLDIDALLPGHRRFVRGEPRPAVGCACG